MKTVNEKVKLINFLKMEGKRKLWDFGEQKNRLGNVVGVGL